MVGSPDLDLRDRQAIYAGLTAREFDVVVIGGGITGAGIARDASMRGMSVALIEANDFAAGTSSRSTKLIHGGLRYLAQGDIAMVREAATERKAVRAVAPHLTERTLFVVPAKSRARLALLRAGLTAYDRLGRVAVEDRHQNWNLDRLAKEAPLLDQTGLRGAVAYPEYITDDARLTLANIRSAAQHGAVITNHAKVVGVRANDVDVRDEFTGDEVVVRGRAIVNAAGPWVDEVRHLEASDTDNRLALTKGIHLVFRRERLPVRHTTMMMMPDKRTAFVIPRGEWVYLGTTDTFYADRDYWPDITGFDIRYLLRAINETFAVPTLTEGDVQSTWSGLRPLIDEPGKSPSEISRRDEIMEGPTGMITIAGGKLTAYRTMAERVVDRCLAHLGETRPAPPTAHTPLPGGDITSVTALRGDLQAAGLSPAAAVRAGMLYGSEALVVAQSGGDAAAEAAHAVLREGALTLEDYWVRRSARAFFDDDGGLASLEPAAQAMAPLLGWGEAEVEGQIAKCTALRARMMAPLG
jgi:glycerol-3-phosphate dehydrogenase